MDNQMEQMRFSVDLSQEEYVRSQELLSQKINGKRVGRSRFFSWFMMVLCVLSAITIYKQTGTPDWSLFTLLILMFVSELWLMFTLPHQLRYRYKTAYNATVYTGYSFEGTVTIDGDGVRKQTASATAFIPYHTCHAFVEAADMMIFCGADGHSIVLPSRFLTEETAEFIRQAVTKQIPPMRRFLLQRLNAVTTAETVAFVPPEETLLNISFDYTEKELVSMTIDLVLTQFGRTLSNKCLLSTMAAAVGYFVFALPPLAVFLLVLLVFLLGSLLSAWHKAHRAIAQKDENRQSLRLEITNRGLRLFGKGEKPLVLPWTSITRAVEGPKTVDFYCEKDRQLMIPKRCIEQMDEFRRLVDAQLY